MEPVLTMELWPNYEWIFVGTENAIQRIPLDHCGAYSNSDFQKCLAKDPHCTSDTECQHMLNLTEVVGPEDVTADEGDVVYLFCHAAVQEGLSLKVEWFKDGDPLTIGSKFKEYEYLLQGEINYENPHGKVIENEVQSYLRVFVNKKTEGVYKCNILESGVSVWQKSGKVEVKGLTVTDDSYKLRESEKKRLDNLDKVTNTAYEMSSSNCVISETELCEDVTGVELQKGFKDPNPYIGMNKIIETT
ncbi:uncharacterized protein LOC117111859 [Anneissia japonica]|uniref:uncharacterized protein LOC117111859 n=1 Tax=Anneissia japonica TaxID=1529436 RepID=UPI0014257D0B|nr:uncharacterized protein LOC117111859 [Anneissia japonica]